MITREEYNSALDLVEAYHKQLFIGITGNARDNAKTLVEDWSELPKCSTRLYHALVGRGRYTGYGYEKSHQPFKYIEDVNKSGFMKLRDVGQVSWTEFVELRGY